MASSRFFSTLLLAASAVAQLQLALSPPRHDNGALRRRQTAETGMQRPLDIYGWFYPYAVNVSVGTPGQEQSLALTFAYSETLILERSLCNGVSVDDDGYSWSSSDCNSGAYEPSTSATYEKYQSDSGSSYYGTDTDTFYQVYGSRSVWGTLMSETVNIGGAEITSVSLRLANDTAIETGFLALGYASASDSFSILEQMADQGAIASEAFSLWAEDSGDGTTGHILFGAVDKSKYESPLSRLQASAYKTTQAPGYAVNVTAAETTGNTSGSEPISNFTNFYASISPTTMITNLPPEVAQPIFDMANASISTYSGLWVVDCNTTDSISGGFALELGGSGGYRLEVDLRDLVLPSETWSERKVWNMDEEEPVTWCLFGVQSTETTYDFNHDSILPWVIGNMALQKTYMVFDTYNMEVGLAPLRGDLDGDADRETFESLGANIPDSEFVGYSECFSFDTWGCINGSDDGSGRGGGGVSSGEYGYNRLASTVAIVTGCFLGVMALLIAGCSIWAVRRCRRIRKARAAEELAAKEGGGGAMQYPAPAAPTLAPAPAPGIAAAGGPLPREPPPAHTAAPVDRAHQPQETTMVSPEPQSASAITLAATVSPESTPREPPATLAREAPSS